MTNIRLLLIGINWSYSNNRKYHNLKFKDYAKICNRKREIPGVGKFNSEQLKSISQTSCSVLNKM